MFLAVLALLPLAGLLFYNAAMQKRQAAKDAQEDALRIVLFCQDNQERMVSSADRVLVLAGEIPAVQRLDPAACGPLFKRMLGNQPGFRNFGLLNIRGDLVASARPISMPGPLGTRPFFKDAVAHGRFEASDFEIESDGKEGGMICGDPVKGPDGLVDGVVFAEMDLGWMTDLPSRLSLAPSVTMGVLARDGTILMRVPDAAHYVGRSSLQAAAGRFILQQHGAGTADQEGLDHVRRLLAYAPLDPVDGSQACVSAGIPDDIAFSTATHREHQQMALLLALLIGALGSAWIAADLLVLRGVRRLLRATQKLAAGDLRTRAGHFRGGGELHELAQAFDSMALSLEQQNQLRDAAERELERRVAQRTAELGEANHALQEQIAERSNIAWALQASNERLDLVMKGTNDGIWDWDIVRGEVYFSPRWKEMLGFTDDEMPGAFKEWEIRIHPDDRSRALSTLNDCLAGRSPAFELEHRLRHKDGSYRWILSRGRVVRDAAGAPLRMAGSSTDLTERRAAEQELRRTAEELRRSNEELEQFAYIASHDLQEPLRMVASYTQLLERRYSAQLDDAAREFIGYAVDGARRMQEFITGLLRYSRVGTEPRVLEEVHLGEVYETAICNLRVAIEESNAKVDAGALPVVRGDPRQLTQLFQNLMGNALKFRKPGQPPEIHVCADREGELWRISVRDNGIGLDPKFSERVFTIFQRLHTRDEYEGTGLGLAICKKIVERHGGRIWVESQEREGATFFFTLPSLERQQP